MKLKPRKELKVEVDEGGLTTGGLYILGGEHMIESIGSVRWKGWGSSGPLVGGEFGEGKPSFSL